MEVPRYWRNNEFRLNPNKNGYRPISLATTPEPQTPIYVYSKEKLLNFTEGGMKFNTVIIYQSPNK